MTERRQAQRHRLKWNTEISGVNTLGIPFIELCTSSDLSISGILLPLKEPLLIGSSVNILIQLPSYPKRFMRYSGEVARILQAGVGIKFDDTRPSYVTAHTAPDSVPEISTSGGAVTGGAETVAQLLMGWVKNHDSKVFKVREGDLVIEINPRMSAGEIEEKIKRLQIFADHNSGSSNKLP
jgi:hypothetical protein